MRELTDIVAAHAALAAAGKPAALATVVGVEGSAYRRPGARMLVAEDGRTWGGVSGGCLERDVAARARGVIASGRPFLMRYDTATEEAADRGVSTGCGGTIDVLIQPIAADTPGPLTVLAAVLADDTPRVLATVVRATGGWQALVGDTADATDLFEGPPTRAAAAISGCHGLVLQAVSADPKTRLGLPNRGTRITLAETLRVGDGDQWADVFLAGVLPPQRLVLVGGGPDVVPLVRIAQTLGWRVAVVAGRPALSLAERFADADERYATGLDAPLAGVPLTDRDAMVVMTHNLACDAAAVAALSVRPRFLGVLGPWHRSQRLLAHLPPGHPGHALESPVGLDVGADTPEEIALSIVAGVQAALRRRPGHTLARRRRGPEKDVAPTAGTPSLAATATPSATPTVGATGR